MRWSRIVTMLLVLTPSMPPAAASEVDPRLPAYVPANNEPIRGKLISVNDDAFNNVMTLWCEKAIKEYPDVRVGIEGKGTDVPGSAMLLGRSTLGGMTRPMPERYLEALRKKYGHEPTPLRVARDMIVVCVHRENPIATTGLTLAQLDAIFSDSRNRGHPTDIRTWGELRLGPSWVDKPIVTYGRNSASGAFSHFKLNALLKGDFKKTVIEQPGSTRVVEAVAKDRHAIGYVSFGYLTPDVVAVPLAMDEASEFVTPDPRDQARYPLSREFLLYVNHKPGTPMDPAHRELLRLIYSREGQEIVSKDGFIPMSADWAQQELAKVGIDYKPEPAKEPAAYEKRAEAEGELRCIGTDTMANLFALWAEGMHVHHRRLRIEMSLKGSTTGPAALLEGRADLAPMSRAMNTKELTAFVDKFGYPPTELRVAADMVGIYVHPENPIVSRGMTLAELDAIYSSTRRRGHPERIESWGQLSLTGEWADRKIVPYARGSATGSYGMFKRLALAGGDYDPRVTEVFRFGLAVIAEEKASIGYGPIGFRPHEIPTVPIAVDATRLPVAADVRNVDDYALTNHLRFYVNRRPGTALPPNVAEFLRYVYSAQGQQIVMKDGFVAVNAVEAARELAKVGLADKSPR